MREQLILSLVVVGAAACAAKSARTTLSSAPVPTEYTCDGGEITRTADQVFAGQDTRLALSFQSDAGDHFVAWPASPTAMQTIEYVMPDDPRANAIERIYDTSKGRSRADWRMVRENVCWSKRGYTTALARYAQGKSLDELASELGLERKAAKKLVHDAMMKVLKRYYRNR